MLKKQIPLQIYRRSTRQVMLFGEITENRVGLAMRQIDKLNRSNNGTKEPIWLLINSSGGDPFQVMAFDQFLRLEHIAINTVVVGNAHSSAAEIAQLGRVRAATEKASILFHHGDSGSVQMRNIDNAVRHTAQVMNYGFEIVWRRTGRPKKDIRAVYDRERFMNAQDALAGKFLDRIIYFHRNNLSRRS